MSTEEEDYIIKELTSDETHLREIWTGMEGGRLMTVAKRGLCSQAKGKGKEKRKRTEEEEEDYPVKKRNKPFTSRRKSSETAIPQEK